MRSINNADLAAKKGGGNMNLSFAFRLAQLKFRRVFSSTVIGRVLDSRTIRNFHEIVYYRNIWATTRWMGYRAMQYPTDLIVKQEIIAEVKPVLLIECGTADGGSALFYAHVFDLIGKGRVMTIDIEPRENLPVHPRIQYVTGSTVAPETVALVRAAVAQADGAILVILDSLHACGHVLAEMDIYHTFVTPGSYMIVEDGEINGHPVFTEFKPDFGPGPYEAVMQFLPKHPNFEPDLSCERYLITHHPKGYLRRSTEHKETGTSA
jgi:cephalosporin hydroxylase